MKKKGSSSVTLSPGVVVEIDHFGYPLHDVEKKKGDLADPLDDIKSIRRAGYVSPGEKENAVEYALRLEDAADSQAKEDGEPLREFFGEGYTNPLTENPGNAARDESGPIPGGDQYPEPPEPETAEAPEEFPRIETHTETQSLKCILTDEERRQCGERMARALNVKAEAVSVLKSVNDQYKAEISKAEAEMAGEASKINSGYVFRTVEIEVMMDHETGYVTRMRKDCGEIIESRKMTDYELQRKIKFNHEEEENHGE